MPIINAFERQNVDILRLSLNVQRNLNSTNDDENIDDMEENKRSLENIKSSAIIDKADVKI